MPIANRCSSGEVGSNSPIPRQNGGAAAADPFRTVYMLHLHLESGAGYPKADIARDGRF